MRHVLVDGRCAMRAKTVLITCVVAALAGHFANHAPAGLRVSNRTDQDIEVSVTYIDWGTDSFVNEITMFTTVSMSMPELSM